ncbi:1,4-alpha-glucan branching protein GlgB [Frigoriflavimonas asaccharolytica]|uniref:1,4-alpha-glucan branching enzyme GlgB n=1 Tax=Frigoriflavimonas asaccharolytica TaxID=2735899 RepID=A0A8J8KBM9_9FLAO|nr:1,4-alpha-glucan branching protein GlgB [Frigoriflavimonas asaccharolytica]NRS92749.1 1,4-alpha-glucan branching enzyme [Frigoriflavimonas asaccharolytica]
MQKIQPFSLFTEEDVYLFREGKHYRLYEKFGSHSAKVDGIEGIYFAVWAPNAVQVSVIGDFNNWHSEAHILFPRWDKSGIWEGFIPNLVWGTLYKYGIRTTKAELLEKSDPFGLSFEQNRQAASMVSTNWFEWKDTNWMANRFKKNTLKAPLSVYELHLGSWMRDLALPEVFLNYKEIAKKLIPYIKEMGFTHVEFMPVMEHPYEPSWGYQITGFFAANSRFGSPQDLMFLIDELHQNEIGVFLDWVPSHFPGDANGLHYFDGSFLYEHEDPRKGYHPEWNSHIFNYGRPEVKSFLISNALFWLDRYHADGLRVDAVTSMLHLDYAREQGQWEPNIFGGNVNLEAEEFLKDFNIAVYKEFPDVITIAEESSDFPNLTKPVHDGGVGFGMKWMMGWMHDTLKYFKQEINDRKYHHHKLTFASMYQFNENYMMPLSHDEVVHGKASMIYKMPGDEWQKFANLRALYVYMFTNPGAKLLFMGNEFGQTNEWNFAASLNWNLLEHPVHNGLQLLIKDLNKLYKTETALFENQFSQDGFEWVEANDEEKSTYVYLRKGNSEDDVLMMVLNLTSEVFDYKIGVDENTTWNVILNSDDKKYAGSGVEADLFLEENEEWMNRKNSISLKLPPLCGLVLKMKRKALPKKVASRVRKPAAVKPVKKITKKTDSISGEVVDITSALVEKQKPVRKATITKKPALKVPTKPRTLKSEPIAKPLTKAPALKNTIAVTSKLVEKNAATTSKNSSTAQNAKKKL